MVGTSVGRDTTKKSARGVSSLADFFVVSLPTEVPTMGNTISYRATGCEVNLPDKVTYQGVRVDKRKMTVIGQNNRRWEEIKTG
jgi:hypothetical protein